MDGPFATKTRTIIVDNDVSACGHLIITIVQAAKGRLVPIAIDPQKGNLTDPISVDGQRILKPSFDQGNGIPAQPEFGEENRLDSASGTQARATDEGPNMLSGHFLYFVKILRSWIRDPLKRIEQPHSASVWVGVRYRGHESGASALRHAALDKISWNCFRDHSSGGIISGFQTGTSNQ